MCRVIRPTWLNNIICLNFRKGNDLLMEYKIFILAVDISKNLKSIDIDKAILKYIDINIDKIREWYSEVWKIMSPEIHILMSKVSEIM